MGVKNAFLGRLLASSDTFSDEQVAQTINLLVTHGVEHGASDIHIEPHERFAHVRYRIDNVLRGMHKLPLAALPAVSMQLKELAHLVSDENHLPQEGRYATLVGEDQFEIQVFTMPVVGGEKIVLHISRRLHKPLSLRELGFWGHSLNLIHKTLSRTHGLIIVATPRRNGKTTTLHSMLQLVTTPAVSVATVERTIEYRVAGASQTQARTQGGVTMYEGLRATLNQDPNIILLSDLPDKLTVSLAIQAAAGGHLILGGMHADDAATALAHLQSMNSEEAFLFAHATRAAISQRLVRKLCGQCRQLSRPDREEIHEIEKTFGIVSSTSRQRIHQLESEAISEGIGVKNPYTTPQGITNLWKAHDEGCEACNHTGYQGAIALVEVIEAHDNAAQTVLLAPSQPDKIRRAALKDGYIPMELDGLVKALRGQTTITEVLRALAL